MHDPRHPEPSVRLVQVTSEDPPSVQDEHNPLSLGGAGALVYVSPFTTIVSGQDIAFSLRW